LNLIASRPGFAFAQPIAEESEPGPELLVLMTGAQPVCATEVVEVAKSFAGFMSLAVVDTVAVFEMVAPGAPVNVTTRAIVAEPGEPIVPSAQFTVPGLPGAGAAHDPWLGVTETNVVPAGKGSFTLTSVAASGPLLLTTIV